MAADALLDPLSALRQKREASDAIGKHVGQGDNDFSEAQGIAGPSAHDYPRVFEAAPCVTLSAGRGLSPAFVAAPCAAGSRSERSAAQPIDEAASAPSSRAGGYAPSAGEAPSAPGTSDPLRYLLAERVNGGSGGAVSSAAAPPDERGGAWEYIMHDGRTCPEGIVAAVGRTDKRKDIQAFLDTEDAQPLAPPSPALAGAGGQWHCELCFSPTVPVLGYFARALQIGHGKRHHCRHCGRTVCGACSFVADDTRICARCKAGSGLSIRRISMPRKEKLIFFVRHAESTWNAAASVGPACLASHALDRDHPISEEGMRQIETLRERMHEGLPRWGGAAWAAQTASAERVRHYYNAFLGQRELVYSSPMLRAVQTAHCVFSPDAGWATIRLLRDAREHFRFVTERDCLGMGTGPDIVARAKTFVASAEGMENRVDCNDCYEQWWSDTPETGAELELRHKALWRQLLEASAHDSVVLVTHSNLIRAVLDRFGSPGLDSSSDEGADTLRLASSERLQNAGVIGVKCVLSGVYDDSGGVRDLAWLATDALLMFGSTWKPVQ